MVTLFGIPNCGSVKKARAWLDARGIAYDFVDFKNTPPTAAQVSHWCAQLGWETVLNRRGTTFRGLTDAEKADLDQGKAEALMLRHPSLIKRPVMVQSDGRVDVGFDPARYDAWLCGRKISNG